MKIQTVFVTALLLLVFSSPAYAEGEEWLDRAFKQQKLKQANRSEHYSTAEAEKGARVLCAIGRLGSYFVPGVGIACLPSDLLEFGNEFSDSGQQSRQAPRQVARAPQGGLSQKQVAEIIRKETEVVRREIAEKNRLPEGVKILPKGDVMAIIEKALRNGELDELLKQRIAELQKKSELPTARAPEQKGSVEQTSPPAKRELAPIPRPPKLLPGYQHAVLRLPQDEHFQQQLLNDAAMSKRREEPSPSTQSKSASESCTVREKIIYCTFN